MTRTKTKSSSDRSKLPDGPATIWISRRTHGELKAHAKRKGKVLQFLADELIARGLETIATN